jgi:uncharacterized membrane protein
MKAKLFPNKIYDHDPLWHVQLAVVGALVLQLVLPDKFLGNTKYIVALIEVLLLLGLVASTPRVPVFESLLRRVNAVGLIALVTAANIYCLERLAHYLLVGGRINDGHQLIIASINIYLTNIIIFGLWYWEMDGGGPGQRRGKELHERDFLYPQMSTPKAAHPGWHPSFIDYLYVSATNATAFSPTDTMPLTRRAKVLMLVQSLVSLITVALVAARAVNILS